MDSFIVITLIKAFVIFAVLMTISLVQLLVILIRDESNPTPWMWLPWSWGRSTPGAPAPVVPDA